MAQGISGKESVILGRYHLLELMALGTTAEVYVAKVADHRGTLRTVAIKKILPVYCGNEDFINAMTVEARLSSIIQHPSVVEVYEFNRLQDDYFIVMEMVEGKDLQALIEKMRARKKTLPTVEAAFITKSFLEGLHAAHMQEDEEGNSLQLVHRDVNPSNILVSYNGEVKVCDFGIAKSKFSLVKTKAGVVKGKARYLSPEQAAGKELDRRSDIFSAGLVLFELITGREVWTGKNDLAVLRQAKSGKLPPDVASYKGVEPKLVPILKKAMATSPSSRYATAAQFARDLGVFLKAEAIGYNRLCLSEFMKELFSKEILLDSARLEEISLCERGEAAPCENLIADSAWADSEIGFSDFIAYDKSFPHDADTSGESERPFTPQDTQVSGALLAGGDTQNEVPLKEVVSSDTDQAKISELQGTGKEPITEKKAVTGLLDAEEASDTGSRSGTKKEKLLVMPLDRKVSGTRPLYNLSEEEAATALTEEEIEEVEELLENRGGTEEGGVYKGTHEDSGDFIFTLGPFLSNDTDTPGPQIPFPPLADKSSKRSKEEYNGEFVINLAELKEEMEANKIVDSTTQEIQIISDDSVSTGGVIEMGGNPDDDDQEREGFIISISDDDIEEEPSTENNYATMSGEFMIASPQQGEEKPEKTKKTETIQIDISMLNEEDPDE